MSKFLERLVKTNYRYAGFTLYDKPIPFKTSSLFSDKYMIIQIHDTTPIGENSIVGFCGACTIKNNQIIPLDGDSYSQDMTVIGYSEFTDEKSNLCLDLLVDEW